MFCRMAYVGVLLGIAALAGWGCSQNASKEDSGTKDKGTVADQGGSARDPEVPQRESRMGRPIGKVLRRIGEGPGPDDEDLPRPPRARKMPEKSKAVSFPDQPAVKEGP